MSNIIPAIGKALHEFAGFPYMCSLLKSYPFAKQINVLCIGKSAYPMAVAATETLNQLGIDYSGYLLTKYKHAPQPIPKLITLEAGHPLPDENSVMHSREIMAWLKSLSPYNQLLILLSGGGSALFEIPAAGFTLTDVINTNKSLLHSGLSIAVMNQKRKAMSQVKQGKALEATPTRKVLCLALSDVANNDPAIISSAPFYHEDAVHIAYNHYRYQNPSRQQVLDYHIIGDNLLLLKTLVRYLSGEAIIHQPYCSMNAGGFAAYLADFTLTNRGGVYHLWGGETPLNVVGDGLGGRCTHLALDFATRIAGHKGISLTCYASDGNDNLDGVAGAFVDGNTIYKLKAKGINAISHLNRCNSYTALKAIGAIIPACEQRINVNDVFILQSEK
jgi:hydroxypyruvate reductase